MSFSKRHNTEDSKNSASISCG